MASLSELKRTTKRAYRRVGRGQSSTRGKQSGRGGKGQTARAGNKRRPELRDIIKKIPKRRGYGKNRGRTYVYRTDAVALPLDRLEKLFDSGAEISRKSLAEKGLLSARGNKRVKIVSARTAADLSKKLNLVGVTASGSAKTAIEKAGGSIK
jgi:large subunit ribosomal protein L15